MDGNVSVIKDIVDIILMSIGAVSCAVLVGGLALLLPSLFRSARNIESITRSAVGLTPDIVAAGKNLRETTEYVRDAAKDVAGATPLLRFLGPAGSTVNIASQGIGRVAQWVAGLFRR